MKKSKLIASVVVFKELHDNNKDIYDVIAEFLKSSILSNKKWHFNSTELTDLIERDFDFDLPEAVIKTTLKKRLVKEGFLKFEKGEYCVTEIDGNLNSEFEKKYETKRDIYKATEEEFIEFIQSNRVELLKEKEIGIIRDNLKQYLLGNGVNEPFTQEISAFIIQNQNNVEFKERLNDIREGLVLYTGVRYTADLNELGKWNNELTIYLDTDIIFYFAGFNGGVYKDIFGDFYKLVKEINHSASTKKIKLRYFEETEKEIIDFFHVATLIVERKTTLDPSKTAMKEIVNGCSTKSDVIVKKNKLFIDLRTAGIVKEEDTNYYENHSYVVEGNTVINELKKISDNKSREFDEEKSQNYLKLFTKINSLRRGSNNLGFDRCRFIILTGNKFVHYLAHSNKVKPNEKDIPFATDIDYITDKFWFKLKKGFGKSDEKPKSFDIITKAQIVLSAQVNSTVQEKFIALNDRYNSGKITKEEAISLNYELRESSLKPEEVTQESLDNGIAFINEFSIEEHIREREILKKKVVEGEEAKEELKHRDLIERNKKTKPLKRKCKFISSLIIFLIIVIDLFMIYGVYRLVKAIIEPADSKIAIIGFILGLLVFLVPVTKYSIKGFSYFKLYIKLRYKRKVKIIIISS
jgi:hypothetical protein